MVSGPKGSQKILSINPKIFSSKINEKNEFRYFHSIKKDKKTSLMWGTYRSLINNAIIGVSGGHEKNFRTNRWCRFRASLKGQELVLQIGFSHEVKYAVPKDINIVVEKQTKLNINGSDKELVSKIASDIKALKPVEPYKAKGIKERKPICNKKRRKEKNKNEKIE